MQKFILFFILSILIIVFSAFLYNTYVLQKGYFNSKNKTEITENKTDVIFEDSPSIYKNYSKEDYDKALIENRVIILFFTSNWCMACIDQDKINSETFDSLDKEGVLGLKIHILDSETTTETDALAKKFDVTNENSFVILDKTGAVNYKYVGEITKELLKTKILEVGDIK